MITQAEKKEPMMTRSSFLARKDLEPVPKVSTLIKDKEVNKIIYVPGNIFNIVTQ